MALNRVDLGIQYFPQFAVDRAIASAEIYVGIPGLDPTVLANQYQAYIVQEDGTQVAVSQPIRTSPGGVPTYNGSPVEIAVDESRYSLKILNAAGSQIYYKPTVSAGFNPSGVTLNIQNYADLRNYIGDASTVYITGVLVTAQPQGIAGVFQHDSTDNSSIDNGGTIIVGDDGRRWKRVFDGDVEAKWFDLPTDGATDCSAKIQAAINFGYAQQYNVAMPAGVYVATGLVIPPAGFSSPDPRGYGFRFYGQGQGQIFAVSSVKGTVLRSTLDAPILTVTKFPLMGLGTTGNIEVDHIRFEGTSTTPVVDLQSWYGQSSFHDNGIYQRGDGDGLNIDYMATGYVAFNYIINGDWNNFGPVVRTGCGIRFEQSFDGGLGTLYKNTARGFLDGFIIGDGMADPSAVRLEQNECSVVTNGITINAGVSGCVLDTNYFEGIEDTCVTDNGNFTKVLNSQMYNGFAIGIDGSLTSNYGSLYQGNYIETSGGQPCTLIKVGSAGTFGGPNKTVTANHLLFSTSGGVVPGVIGIEKIGNNPRLNIFGNAFDPRGPWVGGAGTVKILNSTTGEGTYGLDFVSSGDYEFPHLAHGAISLGRNINALTQANVSGSTLILPNDGSLFDVNASIATSVNVVDAGNHIDKIVILTLANTNMTLNKTGQLLLASNFSGPGTITLLTYYFGATKFAIEIARTTI